jgi:hypothetical protein
MSSWILFVVLFTVFFSTSVGIINSVDSSQYFTTEALHRFLSLDMSYFSHDPHFLVWPDVYLYHGQILSVRGYLFSLVTLPLHLFSYILYPFFHQVQLPGGIFVGDLYEISVTSLFSLFSALGLVILWNALNKISTRKIVNLIIVIFLAFGTYIWKYSTFLTRQGLVVFFLCIAVYCIVDSTRKSLLWLVIIWSLSFGIDIILFISLSVGLVYLLVASQEIRKFLYTRWMALPILIIFLSVVLNLANYGTILFAQTDRCYIQTGMISGYSAATPRAVTRAIFLSTPLYPTVFTVLFSYSRMPSSVFRNFESIPPDYAQVESVSYARRFRFFGLFIVSPFLLLALLGYLRYSRDQLLHFCLLVFGFSLLFTTKTLGFWGGNLYDVRYYYPYVVLFAPGIALGLQPKKYFNIFFSILIVLGIVALFMGWIGVLNMYLPAGFGERKMYFDPQDVTFIFSKYPFSHFILYTFPNWMNMWIPVFLTWAAYSLVWWKKVYFKKKS